MRDIWEEDASNELKARIKRAGLSYAELAQALSAAGEPVTVPALTKKLHRGAFSHAFFLRCAALCDRASHQRTHLSQR